MFIAVQALLEGKVGSYGLLHRCFGTLYGTVMAWGPEITA